MRGESGGEVECSVTWQDAAAQSSEQALRDLLIAQEEAAKVSLLEDQR